MHELFHCIQLRLVSSNVRAAENSHLDSLEGLCWIRLEWRALARALGASGAARASAISDALAFRAARSPALSRCRGVGAHRRPQRGIAASRSTWQGLRVRRTRFGFAMVELTGAESGTSFVWTFAYASRRGIGESSSSYAAYDAANVDGPMLIVPRAGSGSIKHPWGPRSFPARPLQWRTKAPRRYRRSRSSSMRAR